MTKKKLKEYTAIFHHSFFCSDNGGRYGEKKEITIKAYTLEEAQKEARKYARRNADHAKFQYCNLWSIKKTPRNKMFSQQE